MAKILAHPFLSHHASRQLYILAHNLIIPFASPIEKRLLDRFEKANIDTPTLIQQMSEGGSGSLIGLWELSLERARKYEEYKKRKRRRRKSQDIEIIETTTEFIHEQIASTPQELTPIEQRFPGRDFQLSTPTHPPDERPRSRRERLPSTRSRSPSQSPTKAYTYRQPVSPRKPKERTAKGFFQALRNVMSDWSFRNGHKLTHKKSKAAINPDGNGTIGKDRKTPLELKKSGESASKEELKRKRKGSLPNISIHPPPSRDVERSPISYIGDGSPAAPNDDDESEGNGHSRKSRHNRPSYRRRSTSSSITSRQSRHRYSHSKTSSTSSAGSGSALSTPRHSKGSLKVVPATPPPHILTHEGAKGLGPVWGEGVIIARRRRSPFKGPPVGFMSGVAGGKRKGQNKEIDKWSEGVIKEEDEEVVEDDLVDEVDIEIDVEVEELGRRSYEAAELYSVGQGGKLDISLDGSTNARCE